MLYGDIWQIRRAEDWVVIPTNIGWDQYGYNPMGVGLAAQAAARYPELSRLLGGHYQQWADLPSGPLLYIYPTGRLICLPTKPINAERPHLSWQSPSDWSVIRRGLVELPDHTRVLAPRGRILVPMLGAGAGGLDVYKVAAFIREVLGRWVTEGVVVLVHPGPRTNPTFKGDLGFLSNFYEGAPFTFQGKQCKTSEHAFAACKAQSDRDRDYVLDAPTPGGAKRRGREITLRPGWDNLRVPFMELVLRAKFTEYDDLRLRLVQTGDRVLQEGNTWGDRFWGVDGWGENQLGRALMRLRKSFSGVGEP